MRRYIYYIVDILLIIIILLYYYYIHYYNMIYYDTINIELVATTGWDQRPHNATYPTDKQSNFRLKSQITTTVIAPKKTKDGTASTRIQDDIGW